MFTGHIFVCHAMQSTYKVAVLMELLVEVLSKQTVLSSLQPTGPHSTTSKGNPTTTNNQKCIPSSESDI